MNVIVTNKYQSTIQGLDIDIIKEINGQFDSDEIVKSFQNFFFQRMILDITAIKNYKDVKNLQKLSISLDMDKIILFLGDIEEGSSEEFLSSLISIGIYNFTKNIDGVMYLYNNPNSYRDVAHFHQLNELQKEKEARPEYVAIEQKVFTGPRIIGVENVTHQSGATTFTYLMKRQLAKNYSVVGIELNKRDFNYFNEKGMFSTTDTQLHEIVNRHRDNEIILIDTNNSSVAESLCSEIIYLIEPSTLKLNKMMLLNRKKLDKLKDKKIILNQSLLNTKDVLDFEYESRLKVFFNMPPLDERQKDIHILNIFLKKLGFDRQETEETDNRKKILGLF